MAPNPSLSQLLAELNAAPHPDMGTAYFSHVGSHLALARTIPLAWFPKTSAATEAQIGGLIANLHSLTTVDWGAYPLDGAATLMAWMIGNGSVLLAAIDQACAAEGLTPGGEAVRAETQARVMLNYAEVTKATAHAVFCQWTGFVEVEDLVQAEGLTTSGSEWAELMTRALAFAATSRTVSVPESEPERAKLNTWCRRFRDLQASRGGPGDQGLVTDQDTTDGGSPKNVDAEAAAATVKQVPDDTVSLDESLSPAEQAATAAEVFSLSSA